MLSDVLVLTARVRIIFELQLSSRCSSVPPPPFGRKILATWHSNPQFREISFLTFFLPQISLNFQTSVSFAIPDYMSIWVRCTPSSAPHCGLSCSCAHRFPGAALGALRVLDLPTLSSSCPELFPLSADFVHLLGDDRLRSDVNFRSGRCRSRTRTHHFLCF